MVSNAVGSGRVSVCYVSIQSDAHGGNDSPEGLYGGASILQVSVPATPAQAVGGDGDAPSCLAARGGQAESRLEQKDHECISYSR